MDTAVIIAESAEFNDSEGAFIKTDVGDSMWDIELRSEGGSIVIHKLNQTNFSEGVL